MRRILLAFALALGFPTVVWGQCTGVFPATTLCGNLGATPAPPRAFAASGTIVGLSPTTINDLATWANTTGTQLKDASGTTIGGPYTWSGIQTWNGNNTFTGINTLTGQTVINGTTSLISGSTISASTFRGTQISANTIAATLVSATTVSANTILGGAVTANSVTANSVSATTISGTSITSPTISGNNVFLTSAPLAGLVLLNTITAGAGVLSISDTTSFNSNFSGYEIHMANIQPAVNSNTLGFQVFSGGSFKNNSYDAQVFLASVAATVALSSTTSIQMTNTAGMGTNGNGYSGIISVDNPLDTTVKKEWTGHGFYKNTTPQPVITIFGGGWDGGNGAITGFQISATTGNIVSGTVKVYGIK